MKTIEWMERKTTSAGKKMIKASIRDEQGIMHEDVAVWDTFPSFGELQQGSQVEGDIVSKQNGQYTNKTLYAPREQTASKSRSSGYGVKAAQERKAEMIAEAQERKNESIAFFNATNSAIQIVSARQSFAQEKLPSLAMDDIKNNIIHWRDWFLSEWKKYEVKDVTDKHQPF